MLLAPWWCAEDIAWEDCDGAKSSVAISSGFGIIVIITNFWPNQPSFCPHWILAPKVCYAFQRFITSTIFSFLHWSVPLHMFLKELVSEQANLHWLHFLDFFSTVHFWMCPQRACFRRCIVTLVAFAFTVCVFKCVLKLPGWEDAKSQRLHLFDFSPLCIFKCIFKALA